MDSTVYTLSSADTNKRLFDILDKAANNGTLQAEAAETKYRTIQENKALNKSTYSLGVNVTIGGDSKLVYLHWHNEGQGVAHWKLDENDAINHANPTKVSNEKIAGIAHKLIKSSGYKGNVKTYD